MRLAPGLQALARLFLAVALVVAFATGGEVPWVRATLFALVMFALGAGAAFAALAESEERAGLRERWEASDWRLFEQLVALTPSERAALRDLSRLPGQEARATGWLEERFEVGPDEAAALLQFFVGTGWAA